MKPQLLISTRSAGKFPEIIKKLESLPFEFTNLNHFLGKGFDSSLVVSMYFQTRFRFHSFVVKKTMYVFLGLNNPKINGHTCI